VRAREEIIFEGVMRYYHQMKVTPNVFCLIKSSRRTKYQHFVVSWPFAPVWGAFGNAIPHAATGMRHPRDTLQYGPR